MKRLLSMMLAAVMLLSCAWANARPSAAAQGVSGGVRCGAYGARGGEEELSLFPAEMELPMFSYSSGERLRVFFGGEIIPADLFTWESSDTGVVRVDQSGNLTAVAPGEAIVSISDGDDGYAESVVTVVDDDATPRLMDLDYDVLETPFYSAEVGIGPLCGGQPVALKRFINPPGCGGGAEPDPNAFIVSEGWTYTYAVVYKFHVTDGLTLRFETSASTAPGAHASNAYICVFDPYSYLWAYNGGSAADPYGKLTVSFYEEADFYLAIFPQDHTDDAGSGNICLYVYDVTQPYDAGDVDGDHYITAIDALTVMRAAMGLVELDEESAALADIGGDGSVGSDDALAIMRIAMGLSGGPK